MRLYASGLTPRPYHFHGVFPDSIFHGTISKVHRRSLGLAPTLLQRRSVDPLPQRQPTARLKGTKELSIPITRSGCRSQRGQLLQRCGISRRQIIRHCERLSSSANLDPCGKLKLRVVRFKRVCCKRSYHMRNGGERGGVHVALMS